MTDPELHRFLAEASVCRLASTGGSGPHVMPVWFLWDEGELWVSSLVKSQRWRDLERDPRAAAVIDDGHAYRELRGVELRGEVEVVGEVPRAGTSACPRISEVERSFARKYRGTDSFEHDGRHAWLRLCPEKTISWDFGKLPLRPL